MSEQTTEAVLGHLIRLDEIRLVYLGNDPSLVGKWFVGLRNAEGKDTKLVMSDEALKAIIMLHKDYGTLGERVSFPHKTVWRRVEGREE